VCGWCWGRLGARHVRGDLRHLDVVCPKNPERCNGTGYVTANYANRRRAESISELWEVRKNYPELEPRLEISNEVMLEQMGY